jgi:hypothetical protein
MAPSMGARVALKVRAVTTAWLEMSRGKAAARLGLSRGKAAQTSGDRA